MEVVLPFEVLPSIYLNDPVDIHLHLRSRTRLDDRSAEQSTRGAHVVHAVRACFMVNNKRIIFRRVCLFLSYPNSYIIRRLPYLLCLQREDMDFVLYVLLGWLGEYLAE